jgi:hypothetical protein
MSRERYMTSHEYAYMVISKYILYIKIDKKFYIATLKKKKRKFSSYTV